MLFAKPPDARNFFGRSLVGGQGLHQKLGGRASKCLFEQARYKILLDLLFRVRGLVNTRPIAGVAPHQSFVHHDGKELLHRAVTSRRKNFPVHFFQSARSFAPKCLEYRQFGVSRLGRDLLHTLGVQIIF